MLGFPVPVMYEVKLNFQRSGGLKPKHPLLGYGCYLEQENGRLILLGFHDLLNSSRPLGREGGVGGCYI